MKILQVNQLDLAGRRFNGYDLNEALRRKGHQACQYVLEKASKNEYVKRIVDADWNLMVFSEMEQKYELYWQLVPYGRVLMEREEFQTADIVHYHLVHNYLLSIPDFPLVTQAKPSVWTWHDPWAVTGHCVHPLECQGWRTGCKPCPHPEEFFPMRTDCVSMIWELKRQAYQKMDVDIVVASDFMLDFARNSPLGQFFPRVHKIPFGVQVELFGTKSRQEARAHFSVPDSHFVIAFRCETNPYKGTKYIYKMLERLDGKENVTLLCVGFGSIPPKLQKKFHIIDLGWQDDPQLMADFYSACDVFLMPSIAEAFGLMAIEAMASSRPVVCFEGTALPAVTFAPECGIAVPKKDTGALLAAVKRLRESSEERRARGELGRKLAEENYRFEDYVERHIHLYEEILYRRKSEKRHGRTRQNG
ncbi:MAG: glycosyltransferase [Ruminococcus flavefaciens]|nr:glycosyltransferase [Ruminococcus flavefaciens]